MVKEASLPKKSKSVQILLKEKNRILSLLLSDGRLATLSAWPDETGDEGKGALAARLLQEAAAANGICLKLNRKKK